MTRTNLGAAHRGLNAWLIQRASSLYLAGYLLYAGWQLLSSPPAGYAAWKALASGAGMRVATALFFVALLAHAWVGLRSVWMDYLRPAAVRLAVSLLSAAALMALALWAIEIVFWSMRP